MKLLLDALIIILLFLFFGYTHTILASYKVKKRIAEKLGDRIAFYRLFYNAVSIINFYLIYQLSPKPGITIYDLNYPWDIVIFVLQIFSLAGFLWAVSKVDILEFTGIKQIKRWIENNYNPDDLDEKYRLITSGAFKYSRHPIYLFTILFLGLRPSMSFFYLIFYICITVYFLIGSYYEEKKLTELFGNRYKEYKSEVPWLIPYKIFRRN